MHTRNGGIVVDGSRVGLANPQKFRSAARYFLIRSSW
jgi:hypothetical protein